MGIGQHCLNSQPENNKIDSVFEYVFGEDNFEKGINHEGGIGSKCK
jgi:hypothetical protein